MNTEKTLFKLTVSKDVDTPISGETPSEGEKQSTPSGFSSKPTGGDSPNTGFLTQSGGRDVMGVVTTPVVSGAFIFAGIILLLALIAKMKKNKHTNFRSGLTRKRYTTRILGFAAVLMFAAGLGGTISRFMGVEATDEYDRTLEASLITTTDTYKLYCGTDRVTIDSTAAAEGYQVSMYLGDENGVLRSDSDGITNIASSENWDGIGVGEWGYYVGEYSTTATENPMPLTVGVIDSKADATTAGTVPVTFCAKVASNVSEADFSTEIGYIITSGIGNDIDYNSASDSDSDGIANRVENRYGMDPTSTDTDADGLSDYAEFNTYGTDPLTVDTDGDGLYDYSEVKLNAAYGTNPTVADYDGTTSFTYSETINSELSFTVTGTGNVPISSVEVAEPSEISDLLAPTEGAEGDELEKFSNLPGKVYLFDSEGEVSSASIIVNAVETTAEAAEDDDTLGVPVTPDGTELYGASLVFDDEGAASVSEYTNSLDTTTQSGKIIMPVTSNSAIILVGDASKLDPESVLSEDELGGPLVTPTIAIGVAVAIEGFKALVQAIHDAGGMAKLTAKILSLFTGAYKHAPTKLKAKKMTAQQKNTKKAEFIQFILDEVALWRAIIAGIMAPCNAAARDEGYTGEGNRPCIAYMSQKITDDMTQFFKALSGVEFTSGETRELERGIENTLESNGTKTVVNAVKAKKK